jgi:hypothetical protein
MFMLAFPKPANASPGLASPFSSSPTNYTFTNYAAKDISDPTYSYDGNPATATTWQVAKAAPSIGTYEVNTFGTSGAPTTETIVFVDFKMNYEFDGGSDDEYRILYYVSPSVTPVVLQGWSNAAFGPTTVTWLAQSEPNDGAWSWVDITSIRIVVEGGPGADTTTDREVFYEYEAWVSVYSVRSSTVCVNPPSLTDPSSPFTVNINISNVDDLYGWEFKLYYNSTILSNSTVVEETFLSSAGSTQFFVLNNTDTYNATHGRFWVTCTRLGNVAGVSGSGTLANITFTVDGQGGTTPLTLADTKLVGYDQANTRLVNMIHSTTDGQVTISGAVPEFPFGAALEFALAGVIVYIWWRGKRRQLPKLPSNSQIH